MMKIPHFIDDAIRLRFVPFTLKDLTKKWLYSLAAGSITSWDGFIKVLLKKFYLIHKTALVRKTSFSSSQNLMNRFGGTLNVSKTSLSNVLIMEQRSSLPNLYDSLDSSIKTLLETMCQGGFLQKDENDEGDLFENLAEKTIQQELTYENSRNSNSIPSKGGLHSIESFITAETRIANLTRRLKVLETKEPVLVNQLSPNQFSTPGCTYCQAVNHVFEECPVFQAQHNFLN